MAKGTQDGHSRGEGALTIIAQGTTVEGELIAKGVVKVEGKVIGTVRAERQVLVARGGIIQGDVIGREVILGGEVRGSITASERIEIQEGAVVHGDIATKRLMVAEGGEVNGNVTMGESGAVAGTGASVSTAIPKQTVHAR